MEGIAQRFIDFHHRYQRHFESKTRSVFESASNYLKGLMQAFKKNMERMEEHVVGADDQALQYMLTESQWDSKAVMAHVAQDANQLLGGTVESFLLFDESGIEKKGTQSVGVARQWNGRLGKVDNCQVGVFAALGRGSQATLIDYRLYLPEKWCEDAERCKKAGIPEASRVFKTKSQLALEIIKAQRQQGIQFSWVGGDGGYGKEPEFLRGLDELNELFVVDVHKDQRIYLADPQPFIPQKEHAKGRTPSCYKTLLPSTRVDDWKDAQPEDAWQHLKLRDSTQGELIVDIVHQRVWLWDNKEAKAHHWHLIIRREIDSLEKCKYTLSNAPAETLTQRLAEMQGQRYWVEHVFEDGKSEVGMADYQARKWASWHHHMALVSMAMLFMLEERVLHQETIPLLSCSDIETLLRTFLPRRDIEPDEILRQLDKRHQRRKAAIDNAFKRQTRFSTA